MELDIIKVQLSDHGKHVIKTETLKNRILMHSAIKAKDENTRYLAAVGLDQIVEQALHSDGWRSVAKGYFVSLADCCDLVRLRHLVHNADRRALQDIMVSGKVKAVEAKQLAIAGIECDELIEEPSYEDLIADLEADAI